MLIMNPSSSLSVFMGSTKGMFCPEMVSVDAHWYLRSNIAYHNGKGRGNIISVQELERKMHAFSTGNNAELIGYTG
jgi:hypothetical protein